MDLEDPDTEHTWTARTVRPVTAVYVLVVFVGFIALAHFAFHSDEAVRALAMAAAGAIAGLVPGILNRVEYRLTGTGLAKRPVRAKEPREFQDVFAWDELSHMVPAKTGFKYWKRPPDTGPVSRFVKQHLSAGRSGELHVDPEDRARVRAIIDRKGIPTAKPRAKLG